MYVCMYVSCIHLGQTKNVYMHVCVCKWICQQKIFAASICLCEHDTHKYIHTYICVYICMYIHIYIYTHTYIHTHIYIHICINVSAHRITYACLHALAHVCIPWFVATKLDSCRWCMQIRRLCMHVYKICKLYNVDALCIYVYIYLYWHMCIEASYVCIHTCMYIQTYFEGFERIEETTHIHMYMYTYIHTWAYSVLRALRESNRPTGIASIALFFRNLCMYVHMYEHMA